MMEESKDIKYIYQHVPNLKQFSFTDYGLKYVHYIVCIRNKALLKSLIGTEQGKDDVKNLRDKKGNSVAHIAAFLND